MSEQFEDDLTRIPMFDYDDPATGPQPLPPPPPSSPPATQPVPGIPPAPPVQAAAGDGGGAAAGWARVAATPEPPRRSRHAPALPGPDSADPTGPDEATLPLPSLVPGRRRASLPQGPIDAEPIDLQGVDWGLVSALRQVAATQLTAAIVDDQSLDEATRREKARKIVNELIAERAREADFAGKAGYSPDDQVRLAKAVFNSLFGLGRTQPLVDNEEVENIEIYGCDDVLLELTGGRIVRGPAIADSDDQLIADWGFFAARNGESERPFSPAHPMLDLKLPGNHRFSAHAWISPRPGAVIRRHRLVEVSLADLVERDMMTHGMASFLRACVKAKKSILVSGPQGAGKTTLVRALADCLHPLEPIATIETEYELLLHEMNGRHQRVFPFEARPGSGEKDAAGRRVGEITLDDLGYAALRKNRSRIIVGEVRGKEALSMLKAMQTGAGSLSTIHATDARSAANRLVGLALEGGGQLGAFAATQVAAHIDVIVQVGLEDRWLTESEPVDDLGTVAVRKRFTSEIVLLQPGEGKHGFAFHDVYKPGPGGRARAESIPSDLYAELVAFGFSDPALRAVDAP